MVLGRSGETVLEVGTFNIHAEFTTSRPNGPIGTAAITCISIGSAFQMMVEFIPNTTAALMVQLSVVQDSTIDFIPYEASLSIQPTMEAAHNRFFCYGSESGDSKKSICSSAIVECGRGDPFC